MAEIRIKCPPFDKELVLNYNASSIASNCGLQTISHILLNWPFDGRHGSHKAPEGFILNKESIDAIFAATATALSAKLGTACVITAPINKNAIGWKGPNGTYCTDLFATWLTHNPNYGSILESPIYTNPVHTGLHDLSFFRVWVWDPGKKNAIDWDKGGLFGELRPTQDIFKKYKERGEIEYKPTKFNNPLSDRGYLMKSRGLKETASWEEFIVSNLTAAENFVEKKVA